MSEDKTTRPVKRQGRREQDKRALKPEPLPIRARSDIFASSEATHLLDKPDATALLETIDESNQPIPQAPDKTQIIDVPKNEEEMPKGRSSKPGRRASSESPLEFPERGNDLQTQVLEISTSNRGEDQSMDEHTRVLHAQFSESEERTAFFDAHDGLAVPQRSPASKRNPEAKPHPVSSNSRSSKGTPNDLLVDPRPRRAAGAVKETKKEIEEQRNEGPTPAPRRSNRTTEREEPRATQPAPRRSQSRGSSDGAIPAAKKSDGRKAQSRPENRRSGQKQEKPPAEALNLGVFADGATQGQEDIIGQVVEKSWEELPKSSPSSAALKRANADRTKTLWMRIGLGLLLLIAVGFIFRADRRPEQNVQKARPTAVAKPLHEHVSSMALALPLSNYARKVRPGTNVFLMGRQGVLVIIDGEDQSKFIHHDSLARTLRNGRTLKPIKQQLSGVKDWPAELAVGIDQLTSISVVRRLCATLESLGVERISFLTDTEKGNEIGELRLDVSDKLDKIPAAGAIELNVESAVISLALLMPKQPPKKLADFDAFTPNLHKKIDQRIDTFTFEHPRTIRAFIQVPDGLRLSQTVDLAKSLVRDERMTRITVVTRASESASSP